MNMHKSNQIFYFSYLFRVKFELHMFILLVLSCLKLQQTSIFFLVFNLND